MYKRCFVVTDIDGNVKQTYNKLIKGARSLCEWVLVNCPHITLQILDEEGVSVESAWKALLSHAGYATVFVAHNASFDWSIVMEFADKILVPAGKKRLKYQRVFCTKDHSTNRLKLPKKGKARFYSGYKWPTLEELAEKLNVSITGPLHGNK